MARLLGPAHSGVTDSYRWNNVSSSFISEIKHQNGRVKVNIDGKVYEYSDPDGKKYDALSRAGSKGRSFNKNLRGRSFRKTRR